MTAELPVNVRGDPRERQVEQAAGLGKLAANYASMLTEFPEEVLIEVYGDALIESADNPDDAQLAMFRDIVGSILAGELPGAE